jgi:type II secretory pathway pseudopilin PulG
MRTGRHHRRAAGACQRREHAFTLPELLTASTLLVLILASALGMHLFGLRMQRIAETKLSATAGARRALNGVRDQIREAKSLQVGNGDASDFTPIPDETDQMGNAIQVYPTTNTANFVRYYLDSEDQCLKSVSSDGGGEVILARFVTNQVAFQAEDFQGNVLQDNQNNRVVRMTLEFYQWEFPVATVGPGCLYDYYRLQTRITRRAIE